MAKPIYTYIHTYVCECICIHVSVAISAQVRSRVGTRPDLIGVGESTAPDCDASLLGHGGILLCRLVCPSVCCFARFPSFSSRRSISDGLWEIRVSRQGLPSPALALWFWLATVGSWPSTCCWPWHSSSASACWQEVEAHRLRLFQKRCEVPLLQALRVLQAAVAARLCLAGRFGSPTVRPRASPGFLGQRPRHGQRFGWWSISR